MSRFGHVVLLGDSVFDNARYVPGGPSVLEHLRSRLPAGWRASLLAVDGHCVEDVGRQLEHVEAGATHLLVSVGGNDALGHAPTIRFGEASSFAQALAELDAIREEFRRAYRTMLRHVAGAGLPLVVCTIYDRVPVLESCERAGLALFNEVILAEASLARVPVIDLRLICTEHDDFAASSPIEPSVAGGRKIASAVARVVTEHDFAAGGCRLWS